EDGIRDRTVTGVQTCALPIYEQPLRAPPHVHVAVYPAADTQRRAPVGAGQAGVLDARILRPPEVDSERPLNEQQAGAGAAAAAGVLAPVVGLRPLPVADGVIDGVDLAGLTLVARGHRQIRPAAQLLKQRQLAVHAAEAAVGGIVQRPVAVDEPEACARGLPQL